MTPNQKGAIAEPAITKVAVELGVIVSRPLQDAPYDLVFDLRQRLLRVQCKSAVRRGDVAVIHCVRCRRGPDGYVRRAYEEDEIDVIAAYCAEVDKCYLLPSSMSVNRTAVTASGADAEQPTASDQLGEGLRIRR